MGGDVKLEYEIDGNIIFRISREQTCLVRTRVIEKSNSFSRGPTEFVILLLNF